MAEAKPKCGKCGGAMEAGFLPGNAYYGLTPVAHLSLQWSPGRAPASPSFSLKKNAKKPRAMTAWRCTECGFVEFYVR